MDSPLTWIYYPGVWGPQTDCSLRAERDKHRRKIRERREAKQSRRCGKHTIHFLNQVALVSSKARRWAGSRAFSVPGGVCLWWDDNREKVLSITSSMYLRRSGGVINSKPSAFYIQDGKLTSRGDGSKMPSPLFGSRSSIESEKSQVETRRCVRVRLSD